MPMNINFRVLGFTTWVTILGASQINAQQIIYPDDVEQKIKLVENNLAGWVQIGKNDTWTLSERMKKYKINGVSIAVIHDYRIEWARGYGYADVSEKREVGVKTLFQAASISKSLNATGVMRLVQEKRLDLNTDINNYLVSWKFPYDERWADKKITLTELLSHTAGLTVSGFPGYAKGEDLPTVPQILDGLKPANTKPVRSSLEPGKSLIYSGGGTTITQLIVMDVTHQPYDVWMQKNILDPLGMNGSSYNQPPSAGKEKILATGYKSDGSEVPGKFHIYPEQAAAGLWTNPSDLCRYFIETQLSYKGESAKVLTPEMTRLRVTPVLEDAALGVFVNSRVTGSSKYFNHNGGNEGFSCTAIASLMEGNGVVIMTNSDNSAILEEIANSVATVYGWRDYYIPEKVNVIDVESSVMDKYTGKYETGSTIVNIVKKDSGLAINVSGGALSTLYFISDSVSFCMEARGFIRFQTGVDKKVTGFIFNGIQVKKVE
jgi:CubicO group peptidase (beta-lactamase class C family)